MARRIRIETPGFHHIYNRGVERRFVYEKNEDKEKFLRLLCEVSEHYGFVVHAYALMDNHYHLLIENKKENLSAGMRQINALYAQYFNKKYNRVGHLWQDRYKSWCVLDENYLFTLFKYFEANPIKAGLAQNPGEYPWTMLHALKHGHVPECAKESFLLRWYETAALLEGLEMTLSEEEEERLEEIKKNSNRLKRSTAPIPPAQNLKGFFKGILSKAERNEKIAEAHRAGFTQSEIARELGLSVSSVSRIVKNAKFKP
ncbi:transposase [Hydrogenimonas sp.]